MHCLADLEFVTWLRARVSPQLTFIKPAQGKPLAWHGCQPSTSLRSRSRTEQCSAAGAKGRQQHAVATVKVANLRLTPLPECFQPCGQSPKLASSSVGVGGRFWTLSERTTLGSWPSLLSTASLLLRTRAPARGLIAAQRANTGPLLERTEGGDLFFASASFRLHGRVLWAPASDEAGRGGRGSSLAQSAESSGAGGPGGPTKAAPIHWPHFGTRASGSFASAQNCAGNCVLELQWPPNSAPSRGKRCGRGPRCFGMLRVGDGRWFAAALGARLGLAFP